MTRDRFERQLSAAREWEVRVAGWARRRGWYVLPTYDFSGKEDDKAPKMLAPSGSRDLVLPDLQCFKDQEIRWLEVKWKARADVHRRTGHRVTGISKRLWDHYLEVQCTTAGDVYVVFLHELEREVRGASLSWLRQNVHHTYDGGKMGRAGMVFWDYDVLPRWCDLSVFEEQTTTPRNP